MKSNYKKLGDYIRLVDERNTDGSVTRLLGVSIEKKFIESIANTIGTDMSIYKIVRKGQFAYGPVTSRNGDKVSIALLEEEKCIISSSYSVFEIINTKELLPEYLNLWFKRPEFDRYARFHSHGSAREIFDWEEMCNVELPVPEIEEQRKIVEAYNTIERRIALKRKINDNLESQAKTLYTEALNRSPQLFEDKFLTDVCNIRYGKGLQTAELLDRGYYVFGSNGLIGYYDSYMYETEQTTISCRGASSGQVNITLPKAFVTSNSLILEPKVLSVYQYIKWYALTHSFEEYVTGSAQPQLTIDSLVATQVKMPINDIPILRISLEKYSHCIYLNRLELLALDKNKNNLLSVILSR